MTVWPLTSCEADKNLPQVYNERGQVSLNVNGAPVDQDFYQGNN